MDEGRKRVLGIIAGILVAHYLKTTEDLFDTRDSTRTGSMAAAAVQWAERIMQKIDNVTADEKVKPETPSTRRNRRPWLWCRAFLFWGGPCVDNIATPNSHHDANCSWLVSCVRSSASEECERDKGGRGRCHLPRGILSA